ncbi:uncharacterized protein K02A2.6-like [Spodoptera litura]|uniref:RNA-directed DNA polymerase n=1 Tax=Spodoptera litura TaxID=69820 RepID=A0A9J7ES69_SPOLT|nr:uncharacterized protein K02A2.6-like [Spodoptera litura]
MACKISNIVFPGQFNPKTDKWCEYKERLLCSLDVCGVDNDNLEKARSIFLSQCGKDTYSLIVSLLVPKRPTEVPFKDILAVLDQFYEPELNEILQAGKFHTRTQADGEGVQEFVAAIGLLGAKCNFIDLKRQLRDRLVLGVRDQRLRRELLKTKNLTYETAVQLCLNHQAIVQDIYPDSKLCTKQTHLDGAEAMDIDKISAAGCRHCARHHKEGERCPFIRARCFYCKRLGHIASACDRKSKKQHQVADVTEEPNAGKVENMMGVYVCSERHAPPIQAELTINGAAVTMEVDSGASRTIISAATYRHLWIKPPPLRPTNVKLVTYSREALQVLGFTYVQVTLGNKEAQCELFVVSGEGPSLLGRSWFKALDLQVTGICWTQAEVTSDLLKKFPELFKDALGEYKGPEVSLHLRTDATPRFLKARPVPFPLRKQVEEQLTQMINDGILTPVRYSKWATPLRIVKKDDGSLRICGDYRSTVNMAIDVDTYPLPAATESFVKLSGGRIFSKLDLKQAYMQLRVDHDTAMLLTLNTPLGLMRMNRLAFGVNAAPGIFQRVMSSALAGMDGVACLLDDIAVSGKTSEEHDARLQAVLHKLNEMGLRLKLGKCVFASNSINFLGHMIDAEGLHPCPNKVKEIKEKPAPTNKQTLRAFLGLYNFYEKFLPDKATLLEPLYRLLEMKKPWHWGQVEQKTFDRAKDLLASDLTLVGYEVDRELLLICDSSDYGLGAVIVHVMDDGCEKPIMMASRTLQPHERRYGQIDKEALAIMFGLRKFHEFLSGRPFCIVTDHKPLVSLFDPSKQIPDQISPRMLRWSLKLAGYNYQIKYRAGKLIGNADALSRWTELETSEISVKPLRDVLLLEEQPDGWNLDVSKLAAETGRDQVLKRVLFHILHGWPNKAPDTTLQPYWTRRDALSHNKGCLLWCNRVIIPASLQQEVLRLLHAPHAGVVQTKAYARGYVWWPGMDIQIESVVGSCEACQAVRNNPPRDPQAWIVTERPWSRVHVDFAGPFQGKTFFVMIDSYSKWFEAEIVSSMSSEVVITVCRKIFASQGIPDILVSDNGRAFTSNEFNTFLRKNGIKHLYSPPYHPASNGQIERAIQTFKNKLKKMSLNNLPWSEKLPRALYALRTVPTSSTNKTPAEMLNGRKYRTAVSSLHPDNVPSSQEQQLEDRSQQQAERRFTVDQPVLIRNYGPGEKWNRATVEMVEGPSSYMVRTEDGELHRRHADQILARRLTQLANRQVMADHSRSGSCSPEPPIEIPPPELWPDIIGIPNTDGP